MQILKIKWPSKKNKQAYNMTTKDKLQVAENTTEINPTEGQKRCGNYKKGKVTIKGLKITIENPKGTLRSGIDSEGNEWESEMLFSYGYFNGTIGKDGDPIDVFIGPEIEEEFDIYVIDQVEENTRAFDEHKVMFGFSSKEEAKEAYLGCYDDDWKGFNYISTFSLSKFKKWIKNKDALKYPTRKLNMTSKLDFTNKGDENIKIIRMFGEVIEGKTLLNLQKQAGEISKFDSLVLEIASPGGSVSEGLEIMVWLDSLSQQGKQVITVVVANAYSIASLIMLVANIKLISKHGKVMVHNPMVPELQYVNANDLEQYIESLRDLEQMMYNLYQIFTGLDQENIKTLMDEETYLGPQEAVDYGFADMVVDIKPKSYEVATNIKKEINMSKTLNILNRVIGMVNKSEFINQVYSTEGGTEVEINQQDPSTYKIGDRTNIEEGEVKLSDGSKLTIKDFVIDDIDRAVEETAEVVPTPVEDKPAEEVTAEFNEGPAPEKVAAEPEVAVPATPSTEEVVEEEVEKAKSKDDMPTKVIEKTESTVTTKETVATQITQVSKWESEVVQDTFDLGTKVEYVPYEEGGEPYSVGAGEWLLEDGRTVLTDSEGIIRYIKEAAPTASEEAIPATEPAPEAKETDEDDMKAVKEEIEAKVKAEYEAKFKALEEKVEAMGKATDDKFEQVSKFEDVAAKAIDTIASTTTSNFKPNAKSVADAKTPKGSIFSQARQKARGQ